MRRSTAAVVLTAWVAFLLDMTLRWLPGDTPPPPNLVPFAMIAHDWHAGGRSFVVNLVGNVVAFIPVGVLLPLARKRGASLLLIAASCAGLSAAIEVAQFATGRRVGDVDDVLLNTAGGLLGYAILGVYRSARPQSSGARGRA